MGVHGSNDVVNAWKQEVLNSRGNHDKTKKTTYEWEKIVANVSTDKDLIGKIYK